MRSNHPSKDSKPHGDGGHGSGHNHSLINHRGQSSGTVSKPSGRDKGGSQESNWGNRHGNRPPKNC